MIRLKIAFLLIFYSFLFSGVYAQSQSIDTLPPSASSASSASAHSYNVLPLHQLHVGVQVGTQFTATSGYGSGLSTFLSPTLTYPFSNRFRISGGVSVVNTTLYGAKPFYILPNEQSFPGFTGNITQTTLWVSGQYLLGDRITLTGTAYKTIGILGSTQANYPFFKSNPAGAYLNINYKISDNTCTLRQDSDIGVVTTVIHMILITPFSALRMSILSLDNKYLYFKLQEKETTEHLEVQWFFYFYK